MLRQGNRAAGVALKRMLCLVLMTGALGAAAQQGVNNKVVTIGLNGVLSGSSLAGQIDTALKIYLDMLNHNGGVNGYTFKYVERDNALQPAQGVAVAQQLIKGDQVFLMAVTGSAVVQALAPMAASLKAPILTFADGDLIRPAIPNVFGLMVRYSVLPLQDARFIIKNLDVKKLAYLFEDNAIGRPALKTLPGFVSANGAMLVASVGYPSDTTDWAPYAARLRDSGAEAVIFFGGGASQLPGLQKAADAIGYHPKYVSIYANLIPAYLKLAGPLSEGVYIDSFQEPIDSPSPNARKYVEEMKRAGQESAIGAFAGQGWTAGAVIEEGVRRATANGGPLTWESFINALNGIKNQQLGVYPAITYTADDHTGATKSAIYQVRNGKFVQVLPMTDLPEPSGK